MDEMRCARNAFATSFDSSYRYQSESQYVCVRQYSTALHRFVVRMRSFDTQCAYTQASVFTAARPSSFSCPPISTRSGCSKSRIAVPSARNSGLDSTWKERPRSLAANTRLMDCAVFTGTVLFSTTIFDVCATWAIRRAASSQFFRSAARPFPMP